MSENEPSLLAAIYERLGSVQTGISNLNTRLDQSEQRATESRKWLKDQVEKLRDRVAELERTVDRIEGESRDVAEFMRAADIKAAERRGAMAAIRAVWSASSWTARAFGAVLIVGAATAFDSVLAAAHKALLAILNVAGPG